MADIFIERELDYVKMGPKHRKFLEEHLLSHPSLVDTIRRLKSCKNDHSMYQELFDCFIEMYFANQYIFDIISKHLTLEQQELIKKELEETGNGSKGNTEKSS